MKTHFRKLNKKFRKSVKGAISIMLSMVLLTTFSLGSLVMESGRYQSAKAQMNEANLSAALSMLTNYNETLQENYGLFGFADKDVNEGAYYDYLNFNSDLDANYYGNGISRLYGTPVAQFDTMYNLSDPNVLKRQLLEYSKYNIPLNTAAELLDIEELLKEFKKNMREAIPALDVLLDACNAITKLADALEQLYKLETTIANLDNCYNNDPDGLIRAVQEVEAFFTGVELPDYDPAYVNAYDTFKTAVQDKVTYMKEHDAPVNPGDYAPYSQSTLNTRSAAANTAKKNLTNKIINLLVAEYGNTAVFGGKSTVKVSGEYETCITIMSHLMLGFNLEDNNTKKIQSIIKTIAKDNCGYEIESWSKETLNTLKSKLASEPSEDLSALNDTYTTANSSYLNAVSANKTWQEQKTAYDEYQKKIKKFDEDIATAGATYKTRCAELRKLLAEYKGYIDKATGNLKDAESAVVELNGGKPGKSSSAFKSLQTTVKGFVNESANTAITKLDEDITALGTLLDDLSKIDKNYSVTNVFKKHTLTNYYLSGGEAFAFITALNSIRAIDEKLELITTLFDNMKSLLALFDDYPYIADIDCNVTLSSKTISLLPSQTGKVTNGNSYPEDLNDLSTLLSEAKTMLSSSYSSAINKVDPTSRLEAADLADEIDKRLSETEASLKFIIGKTACFSPAFTLFVLVFNLKPLIDNVRTLVDNVKFFVNNFQPTIDTIVKDLYNNTLLNSYIMEKFPNRVSRDDKAYKGFDGNFGLFPSSDTTAFKAACVEYILTGEPQEILNQNSVFWKIFILRALNNLVCVAANPEVMEIIAACNIGAIVVFPLWVYLETNFDMNLLLKGEGGKVPFIKTTVILSPSGLEKMGTSLANIVKDIEDAEISGKSKDMDKLFEGLNNRLGLIQEELTAGHGILPVSYDNYLWIMLFLTSNRTKVQRIADLIQMDLRYQEVYNKGSSASFLMSDMNTFVRVKASANFNSILPIIGMNKSNINDYGIKVTSTKYVGY